MAERQIFISPLTEVTTVQKEPLGTLRFEGKKRYKYVAIKNTTATVAGAAGSMVAYGAVTGYDNNLVVVDLTDADAIPIAAGVLLATVTGTAGTTYYGWVQYQGRATLDTAVTNGAIGAPFYLSTTDKTCVRTVEVDSGGAVKQNAGVSFNATTGVILRCVE